MGASLGSVAIPYKGIAKRTKPAYPGLKTHSLRRQAWLCIAPGFEPEGA